MTQEQRIERFKSKYTIKREKIGSSWYVAESAEYFALQPEGVLSDDGPNGVDVVLLIALGIEPNFLFDTEQEADDWAKKVNTTIATVHGAYLDKKQASLYSTQVL